jgi:hypothetical protein
MHLLILQFLVKSRIFPVNFNQPEPFVLSCVELVLLTFMFQLVAHFQRCHLVLALIDRLFHSLVCLLIRYLHRRRVGTAVNLSTLIAPLTKALIMLSQSETLCKQTLFGKLLSPVQIFLNLDQVLEQDLILIINHSTALYNNQHGIKDNTLCTFNLPFS